MKMFEDQKLDLMFYDSSDWAGKQLRFSWITGGKFYKLFRSVEHHDGFDNWIDALNWISEVEPNKKINSIQFWGHGSPGRVWINGDALSIRSLTYDSPHYYFLKKIKERLATDSTIWFRSCNVFTGSDGKFFSIAFSQFMQSRIAGHTYIVGPWQSGLHTIKPGQRPSWNISEGLKKEEDGKIKKLWSMPWEKNTIFCLTNKIPEGW